MKRCRASTPERDDYLSKPFRMEELLARLRGLIRRARQMPSSEIQAGTVSIDSRTGRVTVNGEPVRLTALEFRVLSYLMHHRGRAVPQSELAEHIYPIDEERDSNTIEVFIARLRRKLGPGAIDTVRGFGYRIGSAGDAPMTSVRSKVLLGAVLWTFGMLAAFSVVITFHLPVFETLRIVHLTHSS